VKPQPAPQQPPKRRSDPSISDDVRIKHLRWMILARAVDDRLAALYKQGGIPGGSVFTGRGQEAYAAAAGMMLRRGDVFSPLIRDLAGRLAFGEPIIDIVRTHLGKRTGPMRGRDGNIHRGALDLGILPMISHLGAMIPVVVGALMARRLKGQLKGRDLPIGMACIGDGGMQTGALHEGLNAAAVERVPLVLLVANNQVSYSTFNDRTFACKDLVDRAIGYGIRGDTCDGTDADDCLRAVSGAVARARAGEGPQMVVATLLRLAGHGQHDDASYVPAELKSRFGDCIQLTEKALTVQAITDEGAIASIWADARAQVDAALTQARQEPDADPAEDDWSAYSVKDLKQVRT
jgi:pyruvate dehydrogenase E1 component alpha subunit/2-oxoisovalerate dehydrogenase E1 component alpha subunit